MKAIKLISYLIISLSLSACSSTSLPVFTTDDNHYYAKDFTHTEFSTSDKTSIKKQASSDHDLLLSLLNRDIPEDQKMMLAFAKNQENYLPDSTIVGVKIKGNKEKEHSHERTTSQYAFRINQDINSVSISAMPE